MKGPRQIISELPLEARDRALREIAESCRSPVFAAASAELIAHALNYRKTTVTKAEPKRFERLLRQAIPKLPDRFLLNVLVTLHVGSRGEMLSQVYDAFGVPHEGSELGNDASNIELKPDEVAPAVCALKESWSLDDLWLCMAVMSLTCSDNWAGAVASTEKRIHGLLRARDGAAPSADRRLATHPQPLATY